jgi:ribosomal protein L3 glutamine methyltransferase
VRFAVSRFEEAGLAYGHGTDNAYDEAAYLALHALRLPPDRLEPFLDAQLLPEEMARVLELIRRRAEERLPAAYLTREAWLGDFRFYVDERVIVPRSFIAELLREGLAPWIDDPAGIGSALDLCTGSGCLAVLLAHAFPGAAVDATDVSEGALEVAAQNVGAYGLEARIRLKRSDLFRALAGRTYDVIVSNPPYVSGPSMRALPAEFRREPPLALAGGEDGLRFVRRILKAAPRHLKPGGVLVVEIGHNRDALEAAFPGVAFTWPETSAGADRVFLLHREQLPG